MIRRRAQFKNSNILTYRHGHDGSNLWRHGESFSHSHALVRVDVKRVHLDGNVVLEGRLERARVGFEFD